MPASACVQRAAYSTECLVHSQAPVSFIELNALNDNVADIKRAHVLLLEHFAHVRELTNYTRCPDCKLNRGRLFACHTRQHSVASSSPHQEPHHATASPAGLARPQAMEEARPSRKVAARGMGQMDFVCGPDYGVASADMDRLLAKQPPKSATVRLPDGSTSLLRRSAYVQLGMMSVRYTNAEYVLKVMRQHNSSDIERNVQEACILRQLQGTSVPVPRLFCANERAILMEAVGDPVSKANLPSDYRQQASNILNALHSAGVRHNDIWKKSHLMHNCEDVELMVDRRGKLRLIDFNMATSEEPACKAPLCKGPWFFASDDWQVLDVLHALHRVNQSLELYRAAGLIGHHGICRTGPGINHTGPGLRGFHPESACTTGRQIDSFKPLLGDSTSGFFPKPGEFMRWSRSPRSNTSGLPALRNDGVPLPSLADVNHCLEQCRTCPSCSVVSVSTHSKQSLWFETRQNTTNPALQNHNSCRDESLLKLPTAYNRVALDDFMTFDVK